MIVQLYQHCHFIDIYHLMNIIDQHDGPQPQEWEPAMASVLEPATERANPQTCPVNCINH